MKYIKWICLILTCIFIFSSAYASQHRYFQHFITYLKREALHAGVSRKTVDMALGNVKLLYRHVSHAHHHQVHHLTFNQYLNLSVSHQRIKEGRLAYKRNHHLLSHIARRYQVPANVLVALWGLETNYGHIQGHYPEIDTLVTLAYYDHRHAMFRRQLIAALKILDSHVIDIHAMRGSWAGAMGQCQFMPHTFLRFAVDYNHDGRKDIWANHGDIYASMANYLHYLGFNPHHPILVPVSVPAYYYPSWRSRYRYHTVDYWINHGVHPKLGYHLYRSRAYAAIFYPAGTRHLAYLVYGDNFHVIYQWNHSTFYVLSVGILANKIA